MREKPIGFRVQLLNHSDTAAYATYRLNSTLLVHFDIKIAVILNKIKYISIFYSYDTFLYYKKIYDINKYEN